MALRPASDIWQERQMRSSRLKLELTREAGAGENHQEPPHLNSVIPKQHARGHTTGTEDTNRGPLRRAAWPTSCCAKPGGDRRPLPKREPNASSLQGAADFGVGVSPTQWGASTSSSFIRRDRGDSQEQARLQGQAPATSSWLRPGSLLALRAPF